MNDGKEQTQSIPQQERGSTLPLGRERHGPGSDSGINGDQQVGAGRALGAKGDRSLFFALTEGMLDRLIAQAEKEVVNAEACVEWYQREVTQSQETLGELMALKQQLIENSRTIDSEQTAES